MRMHIFLNSLLTMYCSISIFMVIFIYFLSNWQIWGKHFTFISLISFLILAICFYFKYNEKLNDGNILFKQLPIKVQLPIRTSTILDFLHKSFFNQFNCLSFTQSKLYMPASKLNRRFNRLRRFLYTQDKILKHFILPNTCST